MKSAPWLDALLAALGADVLQLTLDGDFAAKKKPRNASFP